MGAYIYRLKGTKAFTTEIINGVEERVFDLVFWYKPSFSSSFWGDKPSPFMRSVNMLDARLHKAFDEAGYPKYVRHAFYEDGDTIKTVKRDGPFMEWKPGMICIDDGSKLFEELRRIPFPCPAPVKLKVGDTVEVTALAGIDDMVTGQPVLSGTVVGFQQDDVLVNIGSVEFPVSSGQVRPNPVLP